MIPLFFLLFLTGCNMGPELTEPLVSVPCEWKEESIVSGEESPGLWWEIFNDEILNCLELAAVSASPDLETALFRVEQAWSEAGITRADLFPQLSLAPNYLNSGQLIRLFRPPGAMYLEFPDKPYRVHMLNYVLPLNLSYELDLWGRLRKEAQASCLNAAAEEGAYRTALLTLTTQIASSYYNLRTIVTQIDITRKELEERHKSVNYFTQRYEKGIAGLVDVESSRTELYNLEATLTDLEKQKVLETNRIAMLTGSNPVDFHLIVDALDTPPPFIPAGVPTDILLNRPDLFQAERKRASENARVGAAYASFFPSITLTAALGFISPTTADFLKWQSRYWDLGAVGDQTVFDGARKYSNYQVAWARFDQADASYRQLVLQAFREVEDALSSIRYETEKAEKYRKAYESSVKSLGLSQNRFQKGLVPTIEVIDKQRLTLGAALNNSASLGSTYQATIQLIKALGGSWDAKPVCLYSGTSNHFSCYDSKGLGN